MIRLRRSAEREHLQRRQRHVWRTFKPEGRGGLFASSFEPRLDLHESYVPPGGVLPALPGRDAQVITYVFEGALACRNSTGEAGATNAGEFQRRSSIGGVRHIEINVSRTAWAHVFQISLPASPSGASPGLETKRFAMSDRRSLCPVASPDGRNGSLLVQSSARIYSAILGAGRRLAHELAPPESAWLHIVTGAVRMGGVLLRRGDGAGITEEHTLSLIAQEDSEVLLVKLAEPSARFSRAR